MLKKVSVCILIAGSICYPDASSLAQTSTLGAHVKLTIYDYKDGQNSGVKGHEYAGMALSELILYFSSSLSEKLSVDLQPMFNTVTGATPRFGNPISENKFTNSEPVFNEFRKAVVTASLPYQVEMSLGIVKPRFTWDYGAELFWEEEITGGKFSANDYLGAMHETGIEVYKPFEFSRFSLPTYLYLLNGGPGGQKNEFNDNNGTPTVMVHVEPEIGSLKFLGSLARGKWDDAGKYYMTRYAGGIQYQWNDLSVRSEVAGGNWENSIPARVMEHATPFGYYVKVLYRLTPWARAMIHYDYVEHNFNGFFSPLPGEEVYRTITPGLQIMIAGGAMIQMQYDIANWSKWKSDSETETLKFNRFTAGLRATF